MKKVLLALSFVMVFGLGAIFAQTRTITGTVTGSDDGMPIPGASVFVKGTTMGTVTQANGTYTINVPQDAETLVFSFVGMQSQEVAIAGRSVVNVFLSSSSIAVDEIVVVAYGTAKKESFTGSAGVVKADKLEKRTVSNVTKALDGQVPGVQTTSGSGQPGSGSSVVIRGFGSINASQNPLYVVDGIPYDGQVNAINPNDIESITILKDASAGALYGARGANGVIIITTKKGEAGDTKVNLKATWGIASRAIPRYETLDEAGYIETIFHTYRGNYFAGGDTQENAATKAINAMINGQGSNARIFGANEKYNPFNFPASELIIPETGKVRPDATLRYNEDWLDEMTARNPLRQEYTLTVSGGSGKNKHMYSLGYLNEEGLLKTTNYERFTGRMNLDTEFSKHVKGGLNLSYARGESNASQTSASATSNVFYSAQLMAPIYPVHELDVDGNILYDDKGKPLFDYGSTRPSGAQSSFNSIATLYDDKYGSTNDNVSGRTNLEIGNFSGILEGLKFNLNLGIDNQLATSMTYYNPYFGNAEATKGSISKSNARMFSYTTNQILSYDRTFGDHHLDLLVGHEVYDFTYDYLAGSKTGFPFGGLFELDAATTITSARSYKDTYSIQSVLSRFNYDFQDKYYFSASYRKDGSSRFKKEHRWGDFWSAGASWRISNESFMQDIDWIDNLTVKASYGVQGNDNVGTLYAWQAFYDLTWSNSTLAGALVSSLENKEVKWEKNGNLNIGVEAKLFNRLSATIEWYERKTEDMLLLYPKATSTGFDGYYRNAGSMKNTGFEIALTGEIVKFNDFTYTLNLMGSTINNKVLSLAGRDEIVSGNYIIREGEDINSFYVTDVVGVNPENGNRIYRVWELDGDGNKVYSESENETLANNSKIISGSRIPDLYGSFTNEFKYKGFDLSILCTYSIGGKILDNVYRSMLYSYYPGQAIHVDRAKAWKYPGDITDIPRLQFTKTYLVGNKDLIDASYLSIKNITLGYTLPSRLANVAGIESVRLFAVGDNLLLFNKLKGMDPQYNFSGGTNFIYTPIRTISLGVDLKF